MHFLWEGLGRGGAAFALAVLVGLSLWLAFLPLLGAAAFWVGVAFAAVTVIGVYRAEPPARPPTRRA